MSPAFAVVDVFLGMFAGRPDPCLVGLPSQWSAVAGCS